MSAVFGINLVALFRRDVAYWSARKYSLAHIQHDTINLRYRINIVRGAFGICRVSILIQCVDRKIPKLVNYLLTIGSPVVSRVLTNALQINGPIIPEVITRIFDISVYNSVYLKTWAVSKIKYRLAKQ